MEKAAPAGVPAGSPATGAVPADGGGWRFLIQPRWLGWHVLMVVMFWGMLWLGDWQFHRALSGNALSWAYTFEWPLFSGFAVVFWVKTIRDEFRIKRGESLGTPGTAYGELEDLPLGVRAVQSGVPAEDDDEELSAYNAYLTKLNDKVKDSGRRH